MCLPRSGIIVPTSPKGVPTGLSMAATLSDRALQLIMMLLIKMGLFLLDTRSVCVGVRQARSVCCLAPAFLFVQPFDKNGTAGWDALGSTRKI